MQVRRMGVIGAGAMETGIAQVTAIAGLGVALIDVNDAAIEKGLDVIKGNLQKMVAKAKMTEAEKETALRG